MNLLFGSAALVGFLHSLAPGHWLPVVLVAKTRRWPLKMAILGALCTASGHVVVSSAAGVASIALSESLLPGGEATMERYAALMLIVFGALYATFGYFRHSSCHGHEHHGPKPKGKKAPFLFLFSIGLSPCFAVLPLFLAASARGWSSALLTMASFSAGVAFALAGATLAVSLGVLKLDHPLFEHYGDVLTGVAVSGMGVILFFFPM
jgi:ABC-type nickel/cobalt efflux system permease component RcnA